MNSQPPKDVEILGEIDGVRSLAHQERLAMLGLLVKQPLTGAMVARMLGMPANRVHYHLQQLLKHGLVREHGRGRKRWKEERLFTATARHFLVDPSLGLGNAEMSAALHRSLDSLIGSWRRERLLNLDLSEVAAHVVRDCLRVRAGETVLVMFGRHGLELGEAILVEVEAMGALPRPKIWSRNLLINTLNRHTRESLADLPFVPEADDRELDAVVHLSTSIPEGKPPTEEQLAKLPLLLESSSRWHRSLKSRRIRHLEVALPFRREFEAGRVSPEEATNVFWRCLMTDRETIARRGHFLRRYLEGCPRVTLECERGTDLTLDLDLEHYLLSDGVISPEDVEAGQTTDSLPAGALSFIPIPETATGVLRADYTTHGGKHFRDLRVEIEAGRIVQLDAASDAADLRSALGRAAGDANLIAEVGFGLNPAGKGPVAKTTVDGCLEGTVTVLFGNNELLGGTVRSTMTSLMPCSTMTVRSADQLLIRRGELLCD